jgi:hypothetical protein
VWRENEGIFEERDGQGADFVEGGGDRFERGEIVAGTGDFNESHVVAGFLERGEQTLGLGDGNERVPVAMDEKNRRRAGMGICDGTRASVGFRIFRECAAEIFCDGSLACRGWKRTLPGDELGGAVPGSDGGDAAGRARPAARAFEAGFFTRKSDEKREIAAGRCARYSDAVGINRVVAGIRAEITDRAFAIFERGREGRFAAQPIVNRSGDESRSREKQRAGIFAFRAAFPAAPMKPQHRGRGLRDWAHRHEDVQQEGMAAARAIGDIGDSVVRNGPGIFEAYEEKNKKCRCDESAHW